MERIKYSLVFLVLISIAGCKKNVNPDNGNIVSDKPNIIFIIADDMGWDVFGNYSGMTATKATTPTLDSLARNGLTFTNFWVNPECAPTRAAILTGKYGFRTGVGGVQAPQVATLKNSETIIQKYINDNTNDSYANAVIGKWHVSGTAQLNAPESFGIQYYTGILTGAVNDYYNWTETNNGIQKTNTTYTTTHFINTSINWIKQQDKPFFLWLALNAPHSPFHRPPLNLITDQSLANTPAAINANPYAYYLASIEAMDKEMARLIASLTPEQKVNTIFIFMGDNGTPQQIIQTPYNGTKAKSTLFQGGINTPLIISGKDVTRINEIETALVNAPDLFSTFADIAGLEGIHAQDGISVKPLFTDANSTKRIFVYSELFNPTATANDGYTIRNEAYKYIRLQNGMEYFYHLTNDPFENTNLLLGTLTNEAQQNLTQLKQIKAGL